MENNPNLFSESISESRKLDIHNVFLSMAITFSKLSHASRAKQGCVIVDKRGRIVSTGYNGTPHRVDNRCEDINNNTHDHVIHAELNAILNSTKSNISGSTLYVTQSPCTRCAALILQKGIKRVVYAEPYRLSDGLDLLNDHGVKTLLLKTADHVQ